MEALLQRVASEEFEEGALVWLRESVATETGMTLVLELGSEESDKTEKWTIECESVRECQIGWSLAHDIELLNDHALLAPYRDPCVTLAIRGPVRDVKHAIADLWQAHHELAGDWFPLTQFMNAGLPLADLLQASSAIFAEGPSRFVLAYQHALTQNGADAYTPWQRSPKFWHDGAWHEESGNTSLLLFGPHFVVASRFSAR